MYYLVDFARKRGAKDKRKRKVKRGWAFHLANAGATGALTGMGVEGIRNKHLFKRPEPIKGTNINDFVDRLAKGYGIGAATGLLVGGGILGAKHLRNKLKNKKK